MRFWDASAVVPLCLTEPETARARALVEADPSLVVWWATRTECISALLRRRRDGRLSSTVVDRAQRILLALSAEWSEVLPSENVRSRTERLLGVHNLRAGDAFQLAAALLWSRDQTSERELVSLDDRLREAAQREGFRVLPER